MTTSTTTPAAGRTAPAPGGRADTPVGGGARGLRRAAASPTGGPTLRLTDDAGMTTAEYAVGTVAACGFAGVLVRLLTSERVQGLLEAILQRALSVGS